MKEGTSDSQLVPARLWRVPVYLPYLQPALTDLAVAHAEAQLGVALPRAYLAALRVQNGGYLRLDNHPRGHARVDCIAGIGPRFPSLLACDWSDVKEYMQEAAITTPPGIDALVPFCGDGHYHYCFDYRESGPKREPRVTYIDVETFDVDEVVAPDFATFLQQLRPDPAEPVYGLVTNEAAEIVAAALSEATGFAFVDGGDQDNGYRFFRAHLPGDAAWAWLAANKARRGFVRKSDDEYLILSDLFPELVDRHPEHADCGFFLRCTEPDSDAGQAILRGLQKLPFAVRSVRLDQ